MKNARPPHRRRRLLAAALGLAPRAHVPLLLGIGCARSPLERSLGLPGLALAARSRRE